MRSITRNHNIRCIEIDNLTTKEIASIVINLFLCQEKGQVKFSKFVI